MAYVFFLTGLFLRLMLVLVGAIVTVASVAPIMASMSNERTRMIEDIWAELLPDGPVTWLTMPFMHALWAAAGLGLAIFGLILTIGYLRRGAEAARPSLPTTLGGRVAQVAFFAFIAYVCVPNAFFMSLHRLDDLRLVMLGHRAAASVIEARQEAPDDPAHKNRIGAGTYFVTFMFTDRHGETHTVSREVSYMAFKAAERGDFTVAYRVTAPDLARWDRNLKPFQLAMNGFLTLVNLLLASFGLAGLISSWPWRGFSAREV